MHFDPGYKYIKKFRGTILWYMMETEEVISNINFILKNEKRKRKSFDVNQYHPDYQKTNLIVL